MELDTPPVRPRWVHAHLDRPWSASTDGRDATPALRAQLDTDARSWLRDNLPHLAGHLGLTPAQARTLDAVVEADRGDVPVPRSEVSEGLGDAAGAVVQRLHAISRRLAEAAPVPHTVPAVRVHLLVVHAGVDCEFAGHGTWRPRDPRAAQFYRVGVDHLGADGWQWGLDGPYQRPTNLWPPLDPLIGREAELATIRDAFANARLVVLTGPSGIGKTRLAEAWATGPREALAVGRGGVWRVDPKGSDLLDVVARARGQPAVDALAGTTLLVVDDPPPSSASTLDRWVSRTPDLRILATSAAPWPGTTSVVVAPLDSAAAARLYRSLVPGTALGRPDTDEEVARIVAVSCGNPGRLVDLAHRRAVRTAAEILAESGNDDDRLR